MNVIDPQQLHQHAAIRRREVAEGIAAERRRQAARPPRDWLVVLRAFGRPLRRLGDQRVVAEPAPAPTAILAGDAPA